MPSLPPLPDDPASNRSSAFIALAIGVTCGSASAIFARLAACPALAIAAWRLTFASAVFGLVLWRHRADLAAITRRDLLIGGISGLCLSVHFATWISSLDYTTVASSVVLVNTTPLWVALLAPLLTGERTTRRAWTGIGVSFFGAAIIAGSDLRFGGKALLGDGLALAGGVAGAVYFLLGRQLRAHLSLVSYCSLTYGAAMVALWLIALVAGTPVTGFAPKTWAAIAAMALVAQVGAHTLYNWSLKHLATSAVAVALLGEPIGSALLAWRFFGEVPPAASLGGAVLVLIGIYVASTEKE